MLSAGATPRLCQAHIRHTLDTHYTYVPERRRVVNLALLFIRFLQQASAEALVLVLPRGYFAHLFALLGGRQLHPLIQTDERLQGPQFLLACRCRTPSPASYSSTLAYKALPCSIAPPHAKVIGSYQRRRASTEGLPCTARTDTLFATQPVGGSIPEAPDKSSQKSVPIIFTLHEVYVY